MALYTAPHKLTRRQGVALVTLRNAPDPWSAFKQLLVFTYESAGSITAGKQVCLEFLAGLFLCVTSLAVFVVSIVMGILGPTLLDIGSVAPVRPSILYFPKLPPVGDELGENLFNGHRSLGILRALSSVEIAKTESRSKVSIQSNLGSEEPPTFALQYNYNVSAVDFGLTNSAGLGLGVSGACRTEYAWLNTTNPYFDKYTFWGDESATPRIWLNGSSISMPPRAYFFLPGNATAQFNSNGNVSYAVLATTAHRPSISESSDPWYTTEQQDLNTSSTGDYSLWIARGRPALSCWQHDQWSYGDQRFANVVDLANAPNGTVPIPEVLLQIIASVTLMPMIVSVANIVGPSALESAVTGPDTFNNDGLLDARTSSIQRDMERLIVAAFINTQNILTDCAMSDPTSNRQTLPNSFTGIDGLPQDGAGQFVVSTPNVRTFTLDGLIGLAVVVIGLLLLKTALFLKLAVHADTHADTHTDANTDANTDAQTHTHTGVHISVGPSSEAAGVTYNYDRWARFKGLSASSLLRMVYENGRGVPQPDWMCCEEFPTDGPNDNLKPFQLAKCQAGACSCGGHIVAHGNSAPQGSPPDSPPDSPLNSPSDNADEKGKTAEIHNKEL